MDGSWWKDKKDLDETQVAFIDLPADGKYLLIGPAGSGKTNLLLLRGKFLVGCGMPNVTFLTYTNNLSDFIKTGAGTKLPPEQITTFHKWVWQYVRQHAPAKLNALPSNPFDNRQLISDMIEAAYAASLVKKPLDAMLIDEAQDLTAGELFAAIQVSDRVSIAGDLNQRVYQDGTALNDKAALEHAGFTIFELKAHYRIGMEICKIADKIIPPSDPSKAMLRHCNYNETDYASSANLNDYPSRDGQFQAMLNTIQRQLKAYPKQGIGIFAKGDAINELKNRLESSDLAGFVAYHDIKDDPSHSFQSGKRIHVLTIHGAKGTEFRAVHIFGCEQLDYTDGQREVMYTAVTRAKTSLNCYYSGKVAPYITSAFSKPTVASVAGLFED